jgi:hypothetical protein
VPLSLALPLVSCARSAPPAIAPLSLDERACIHWVEEFRVPKCVGELTAAARAKRESYFLLRYQGGRAVQVARQLRDRPDDGAECPVAKYVDAHGVVAVTCEDSHGVVRRWSRFEADGAHVYWFDRSGRPRFDGESEAAGMVRDIDSAGRVVGYRYIGVLGTPQHDADAVYRVRPIRGAAGELVAESYWDADDRPMLGPDGAHLIRYEHDRDLNPIRSRFFGVRGEPVLNKDGFHEMRTMRDDAGNDVRRSYWDDAGQPVIAHEGGAAVEIRRDARGFEVSRAYLDAAGRPTLSRHGYATRRIEYDGKGREVRWSHYGVDGQRRLRREGHWAMDVTFDADDRIVAESFLGTDGRPVRIRGGYARVTTEHDKLGNPVLLRYFGVDGRPAHAGSHVAVRSDYDENARLVRTTYLDLDGRPTNLPAGYARVDLSLDRKGRVSKRTYLDRFGIPVPIVTVAYIHVQYAGAENAPARITRSAEDARARAEDALGWLRAGADFDKVEARWSDAAYDGPPGPIRQMLLGMRPEWIGIVPSLFVGVESKVIELKSGFWILKRLP